MNILAISGSLRKDSYNTALLHAVQDVVSKDSNVTIYDLSKLPIYNQDLEDSFPKEALDFKKMIEESDAVVIATPEFNRSISGVLKNALDWASRPWGENSFAGKYALVLGASIGAVGTAIAQQHLKQILLFLDMNVIGQPEFFLGDAAHKFNEDMELVDIKTIEFLTNAVSVLENRVGL